MSDEIVVIANPQSPPANDVPYTPSSPYPGGSGNPANHPAVVANRENQAFSTAVLKKEEDVTDEEIIVTGSRFRFVALELAGNSTAVASHSFPIPCFGNSISLRATLLSLRFNLTKRTFGPGRAGANYASGGATTPIDINLNDFKGYMAYGDGGAGYLIAHEMAHTFKVMRDFNALKFREYRNGPGKDMSLAAAQASFANTSGFQQVEARANTIAKAIYKLLSQGKDFGFTPTNGYATC